MRWGAPRFWGAFLSLSLSCPHISLTLSPSLPPSLIITMNSQTHVSSPKAACNDFLQTNKHKHTHTHTRTRTRTHTHTHNHPSIHRPSTRNVRERQPFCIETVRPRVFHPRTPFQGSVFAKSAEQNCRGIPWPQ